MYDIWVSWTILTHYQVACHANGLTIHFNKNESGELAYTVKVMPDDVPLNELPRLAKEATVKYKEAINSLQ